MIDRRVANCLQSMPVRIEMCIFESSRIFQTESEHSIEPDMSYPDQQNQQCGILTGPNRVRSQREWPNVGMHNVVRRSAHACVRGVADHRKVRHEKQKDKLDPATMVPAVRHQADDENCGAFEMEQWFRVNSTINTAASSGDDSDLALLDCSLCSDIFFSLAFLIMR
jgi:hypothetical protein